MFLLLGILKMTGLCLASDSLGPEIVVVDNDRIAITEPKEDNEGDYILWDGVDAMVFNHLEKCTDLGFVARKIGTWLGIVGPSEAENVNALDNVPDSSWFTNRHEQKRMSREELQRGTNRFESPDSTKGFTVIAGKGIGLTPGFIVEDGRGDRYILKFDPPRYPEMATATEMIVSRFMYAAGYNIPEYYLVTVDPHKLVIKKGAKITGKYKRKRLMTHEDLEKIFNKAACKSDGTYRAIASKFIDGTPKGPPLTRGRRRDDPNDTVFHENRRELRGLRVVSSFLNNTDSRRGNYLDTYLEGDNGGYIKHYLLDFSASMGSGNIGHKDPKYGSEYVLDPKNIILSFLSLGFWVKPWEKAEPAKVDSVGTFEMKTFDPKRWKTSFANPMFQRMTPRDAFWAAKIITAFTDEDIRSVVETGQWSDPAASSLAIHVFKGRRDKIGKTWFHISRINPLDRFNLEEEEPDKWLLNWRDLPLARGILQSEATKYRYRFICLMDGKKIKPLPRGWHETSSPEISLSNLFPGDTGVTTVSIKIKIQTSRDAGKHWSPTLTVYLQSGPKIHDLQVLGLFRKDG